MSKKPLEPRVTPEEPEALAPAAAQAASVATTVAATITALTSPILRFMIPTFVGEYQPVYLTGLIRPL